MYQYFRFLLLIAFKILMYRVVKNGFRKTRIKNKDMVKIKTVIIILKILAT